jgi:hypothetical protein
MNKAGIGRLVFGRLVFWTSLGAIFTKSAKESAFIFPLPWGGATREEMWQAVITSGD